MIAIPRQVDEFFGKVLDDMGEYIADREQPGGATLAVDDREMPEAALGHAFECVCQGFGGRGGHGRERPAASSARRIRRPAGLRGPGREARSLHRRLVAVR